MWVGGREIKLGNQVVSDWISRLSLWLSEYAVVNMPVVWMVNKGDGLKG